MPYHLKRPNLGKECDNCHVPIDPTNHQCSLCLKQYSVFSLYDKDRCEHCGNYDVYMDQMMHWWCEDCQMWIDSTNEGNGDSFGDCVICCCGFRKERPEQTCCEYCL